MAKRSRNTVKRKRRRLIFGIELVVLLVLVGVLLYMRILQINLAKLIFQTVQAVQMSKSMNR